MDRSILQQIFSTLFLIPINMISGLFIENIPLQQYQEYCLEFFQI